MKTVERRIRKLECQAGYDSAPFFGLRIFETEDEFARWTRSDEGREWEDARRSFPNAFLGLIIIGPGERGKT